MSTEAGDLFFASTFHPCATASDAPRIHGAQTVMVASQSVELHLTV
jgi:hypothetical protein